MPVVELMLAEWHATDKPHVYQLLLLCWFCSTQTQALARTARSEVLQVNARRANVLGSACTLPWTRKLMWTVGAVGRPAHLRLYVSRGGWR